MPAMTQAMLKEIVLRAAERTTPASSVYFGGGTPSLLPTADIVNFLTQTDSTFGIDPQAEITLEANPEDLTPEKLQELKHAGINRLSIGIQSFEEAHLQRMNRTHSPQRAYQAVKQAQKIGFENISIDLMYGLPQSSLSTWKQDLQKALSLGVPHISAYCLTIEDRTVFGNWVKKGKIKPAEEELAAQQFEVMAEILTAAGYEHYEISNFALPNYYSRHNTNYWKKGTYIGIGPSAHSYNGKERSYNLAHNAHYIKAIQAGKRPATVEILSQRDHINEYLLTSLRTQWGCNIQWLKQTYHYDLMASQGAYIQQLLEQGYAIVRQQHLILTLKGKLLADSITLRLFL